MIKTIMKFTESTRYADYTMNVVQCKCIDLISNKLQYYSFTRKSKLYNRVANIKYSGEFTEIVSCDEDRRNNVRIIEDEKLKEEYPELLI